MKKSELTQLTQLIELLVEREVKKQLPALIGEVFQNMAGKSMVTERVVHAESPGRKDCIAKEIEAATIKKDPNEFRSSLKELFTGSSPVTRAELENGVPPPPPRVIKQYTKDPVLNQILNETTGDLRQREGLAGMAAFQGGYNPMPGQTPGPMPSIPISAPSISDGHAPMAALPEGLSALDVAKAVTPAPVAEAMTNFARMKAVLDASKKRRF
jgi:hypothetical protein